VSLLGSAGLGEGMGSDGGASQPGEVLKAALDVGSDLLGGRRCRLEVRARAGHESQAVALGTAANMMGGLTGA